LGLRVPGGQPPPPPPPWTMMSSGVEIGSLNGSGDSWWSVRLGDGGAAHSGSRDERHRQVCFAWNMQRAAHKSSDLCRWAGDEGGPALLSIGGEWALSTIDGGIQRWWWHPVSIDGSKP
jgi:hypothetical protein